MIIIIAILLIINGYLIYLLKKPKKEKPKMSKEEIEKQKEVKKAFDNLMNYDFNVATRRNN